MDPWLPASLIATRDGTPTNISPILTGRISSKASLFAFFHFDGERYRLIAWVVMPNHVHVLIELLEGYPLGEVIHSWKSYTANKANEILGRQDRFWFPD